MFVDAGFNKTNPTRLALIAAPITPGNIKHIFEIYKWGRERNLYVVSTPTMVSGRGSDQKKSQEENYGKNNVYRKNDSTPKRTLLIRSE